MLAGSLARAALQVARREVVPGRITEDVVVRVLLGHIDGAAVVVERGVESNVESASRAITKKEWRYHYRETAAMIRCRLRERPLIVIGRLAQLEPGKLQAKFSASGQRCSPLGRPMSGFKNTIAVRWSGNASFRSCTRFSASSICCRNYARACGCRPSLRSAVAKSEYRCCRRVTIRRSAIY